MSSPRAPPMSPPRASIRLESMVMDKIDTMGTGEPTSRQALESAWDEEKCRNVLVRFCSHIPRNFQYRDGIQKIFLILRDHLGDEHLDLAGGVLYELIEVDCTNTYDVGAAFQRWRHHHMQRHVEFHCLTDLQLPHVPHMTTITSSIRPTTNLTLWRDCHPDRYPIRLSDASPPASPLSGDPSTIRSQKPWMIENTMWVSSRHEGTRPVRRQNPREFHEMQWNSEFGRGGKLVEAKVVVVPAARDYKAATLSGAIDSTEQHQEQQQQKKKRNNGRSRLRKRSKIKTKTATHPRPEKEQRGSDNEGLRHRIPDATLDKRCRHDKVRQSWFGSILGFDTLVSVREFLDNRIVSLPSQIPHPVFVRKNCLIDESHALHPDMPSHTMPTTEATFTDTVSATSQRGHPAVDPMGEFRGPLTPQL